MLVDDELGGALADHHAGGVRVAARRPRHHGGVGDAEAADAVDAEAEVDDGLRLDRRAEAAGAREVVDWQLGAIACGAAERAELRDVPMPITT